MIFAIRRISDKAFFGTVNCTLIGLFDAIDEYASPYEFEYSKMQFKHTSDDGVYEWYRFATPTNYEEYLNLRGELVLVERA